MKLFRHNHWINTFFASINLWHAISTGLANAGCSTDNVRSVYFIESINCCEDASRTKIGFSVLDDKLLNVSDENKTVLSGSKMTFLLAVGLHSSLASRISVPLSFDGTAGTFDTRPTLEGCNKPVLTQIPEEFKHLSSRLSSSTWNKMNEHY